MIRPFQVGLLSFLLLSNMALAGTEGVVSTCYSDKLPNHKGNENVSTELFVIVDQTTVFDQSLRQSIANNIKPFIQAGNAISVTQFSAFTQGHYTEVLVNAKLDHSPSQEQKNDTSKPVLSKFENCIAKQPVIASRAIGSALKNAFGSSSSNISKSDVITSLKDVSLMVKNSKAQRKVVLIASDMLENSSLSSFYAKQAVRQINHEKELKVVSENQQFGDFGGAKVYVIGAGLLAEDAKAPKGVYRSPQIMQALSTFWKEWFKKSNAEVVEFGQPALLNPIN